MSTGTFTGRIALLRRRTHLGETLDGSVEVNQAYALKQHEDLSYRHPRGGQALYLRTPLQETYPLFLGQIAHSWLDDGGASAMKDAMERLSDLVGVFAPIEFGFLRRSGHPRVERGGLVIYDRAPYAARLTAVQLEAEERATYPGLPARLKGWIWWHLQRHTSPPGRGR